VVCGRSILQDIESNSAYFSKLRAMVDGRIEIKGNAFPPVGAFPNISFYEKVDAAVALAHQRDLAVDLILRKDMQNTYGSAYLRYIAARYGSYPNVWICVANEWSRGDQTAPLSAAAVARNGLLLKNFLGQPTPLSVHGDGGQGWNPALNSPPGMPEWQDHKDIQQKIHQLEETASWIVGTHGTTPTSFLAWIRHFSDLYHHNPAAVAKRLTWQTASTRRSIECYGRKFQCITGRACTSLSSPAPGRPTGPM
jgi:hypothetical protein